MPTSRTATISVATYAWTKLYTIQFLVFISVVALTWSDLNVIDCLWAAYR